MKRITLVIFLLALLMIDTAAQGHTVAPRIRNAGKTDKIGLPGIGAFYDVARYNHDGDLAADFDNFNDRIIKNIPEKKGTFVLDGKTDLARKRELLEHPNEIQFDGDYVEFPYKDGETNYRVSVLNISKHHELSTPEVADQMRACIKKYRDENGNLPGYVAIRHNDEQKACYFYPYSDIKGIGTFSFAFRLNMGCVRTRTRLLKSPPADYVKN